MPDEISICITLVNPPAGIAFGLQEGKGSDYHTIQKQISARDDLEFSSTIRLKEQTPKNEPPDFAGPIVQGKSGERFIYIDIGTYAGETGSIWGRRLKIPLAGIDWDMINRLKKNPGLQLQTRVPGTGKDGGPNCATVKPFPGWTIQKKQ